MNRLDPKGLFEWDGNKDNLPPVGKLFIYNNQVWFWEVCDCGCEKPLAYTEDGQVDVRMSIRLRGPRTSGLPIAIFLSYIGATDDEICETYGDFEAITGLLEKYMSPGPVQRGLLTEEEMAGLMEMLVRYAEGRLQGLLSVFVGKPGQEKIDYTLPPHDNMMPGIEGPERFSKN